MKGGTGVVADDVERDDRRPVAMADLAERMQCAPLNAEMSRHAAELAGASQVAAGWAKRIRAEVDYQCSKL